MKKEHFQFSYTTFDSANELNEIDKIGIQQAQNTRLKAYAPYSNFLVGAAILLENNQIVLGNNQENAAYPSGLCAERTALYFTGANYPEQKIKKIYIAAAPRNAYSSNPIPPCGSCRQAIAEYEIKQNLNIEIYFMGNTGKIIKVDSIKNLLPFLFDKNSL